MPETFLICDFPDEESAQHARHKIEGWKQAFRLGEKIRLKFEREEQEESGEESAEEPESRSQEGKASSPAKPSKRAAGAKASSSRAEGSRAKGERKKAGAEEQAKSGGPVRLLIRLSFSEHEKLSYQRWFEQIRAGEALKAGALRVVRGGEADFEATREQFGDLR